MMNFLFHQALSDHLSTVREISLIKAIYSPVRYVVWRKDIFKSRFSIFFGHVNVWFISDMCDLSALSTSASLIRKDVSRKPKIKRAIRLICSFFSHSKLCHHSNLDGKSFVSSECWSRPIPVFHFRYRTLGFMCPASKPGASSSFE